MGLFGISEDYLEKGLSLDQLLIKDRVVTFFFRAGDEAMSPVISKDDLLIVDRSIDPENNDIVIISYLGELLVRRVIINVGTQYCLADNSDFADIIENDIQIWGVVTATVKRFR